MLAMESRRVRTQLLTVTGASAGALDVACAEFILGHERE
jgi:hypothetical protein